jgi:hypothetical protein
MTRTHKESQGADNHAPLNLPMKKRTVTINGSKVTINFKDRPDKAVIGEVKRIILDRLAKTS